MRSWSSVTSHILFWVQFLTNSPPFRLFICSRSLCDPAGIYFLCDCFPPNTLCLICYCCFINWTALMDISVDDHYFAWWVVISSQMCTHSSLGNPSIKKARGLLLSLNFLLGSYSVYPVFITTDLHRRFLAESKLCGRWFALGQCATTS